MKKLKQTVQALIHINDVEWKNAKSIFKIRNYKKGDLILYPNKICNVNHYVLDGIVRSYLLNEFSIDTTIELHVNDEDYYHNPFFGDFVSYATQKEGEILCEALTDCTIAISKFNDIEKLYASNIKWMKFGKIMAEMQIVKLVESKRWATLSAKERFKHIKKNKLLYTKLLPDYHLASLIGITPQSLSRIKKEL